MTYVTMGAERGSQLGCYVLAKSFAAGDYGLPEDAKQATKWYRKMLACTNSTDPDCAEEEAAAWLREHATD